MNALSSVSDWMPRPFCRADTTELVPRSRPTASPWEVVRFVAAFVDFRTGIFVDSYFVNSRDERMELSRQARPAARHESDVTFPIGPIGPIGPEGSVSSQRPQAQQGAIDHPKK